MDLSFPVHMREFQSPQKILPPPLHCTPHLRCWPRVVSSAQRGPIPPFNRAWMSSISDNTRNLLSLWSHSVLISESDDRQLYIDKLRQCKKIWTRAVISELLLSQKNESQKQRLGYKWFPVSKITGNSDSVDRSRCRVYKLICCSSGNSH